MTVTVVVDDREPAGVVDSVRSHPDVDAVEVRRLAAGDLVIADVGIERKTLSDYVNGLLARAGPDLYDQVHRLREAYDHAYLLLESQFPADGDEDVPATAVRGSAASITARHGVPVIPCSDRSRLVDMTIRLGRKHVEEPSTPALPNGSVTVRDAPTTKRIYGCIDGVGPGVADDLYEVFPTVESLVAASMEDLLAVSGIGPKRAEAIFEAVRSAE